MWRRVKEQWRSVQCEEEALKGDRKAFNCNKKVLNEKDVQDEEEAPKGNGKAFNCKEEALN